MTLTAALAARGALMALMSSVMAVRGLIRTDPAPAALMETVET